MKSPIAPEEFSVTVRQTGHSRVLRLRGELDAFTRPELTTALAEQNGTGHTVVIDLTELTFIDSGGIHTLFSACTHNGTRVVCPPGNIRRVLDIVSFSQAAPLHETLEDVLAP
jgi:anti-anti-sigma factor